MAHVELANSTFLEFTSHGMTDATTVAEAYDISGSPVPLTSTIKVALVLPRATDATALLGEEWGGRQQSLAELEDSGTLWSTYGATTADYDAVLSGLNDMGISVVGDANGTGGYVTSQESRTIWVSLDPSQFQTLFGTTPYQTGPLAQDNMFYWEGHLSLPEEFNVTGLWFDAPPWWGTYPAVSDLSGGVVAALHQGPQSIGNQLSAANDPSLNYAGDIADWFYNFPLTDIDTPTATVGLVEPGIGDAIPVGARHTFQQGLDSFRESAGITTPGDYYAVVNNGQNYALGNHGERSLDVGVVTSANPNSTFGLYAGSGFANDAYANAYTAYQAAFWDLANAPPVISSSFGIFQQAAPDSPFASAVRELFIDAALRNISTFVANNDWGSSYNFGNGLANQNPTLSSPYAVLVGGTSITTVAAAPNDPSVSHAPSPAQSVYGQAMAGELSMLWRLIEGGLTTLPSAAQGQDAAQTALLESVWNVYALHGNNLNPGLDLSVGGASDGGVDTTQPTPWYQTAFGLTPTSANPSGGTGRGAPDVAALSGGNMYFYGPAENMQPLAPGEYWDYWGTSAATPLWASLAAQIDTIFEDQGLPNLGYMNDLLYMAAAIAPAAFNDITFGNNTSSYVYGGPINSGGTQITLTGFGYNAGPGYDLTTGLGTPNGTLLARALTAIAHEQVSFDFSPHVLDHDESSGWTTPVGEALLIQATSHEGVAIEVTAGTHNLNFHSGVSSAFAWTSQLAQQSLQAEFDPALVRMFDKYAQGWVAQSEATADGGFSVTIDGAATTGHRSELTSGFGFVDFIGNGGASAVRVALPVAVAETAGGLDDQQAVVRIRQNGEDTLSLMLYRVDDHSGTIDGLRPGEAGYEAAASGRAYATGSGGSAIGGPGYGNYAQTMLADVDAADLIAMQLTNQTSGDTFWAFSQANEANAEGGHIGHLWNYGLNTWGWEDLHGGGDRDYNDLIVQLDFTSASGHGWLV